MRFRCGLEGRMGRGGEAVRVTDGAKRGSHDCPVTGDAATAAAQAIEVLPGKPAAGAGGDARGPWGRARQPHHSE
jgi:hypothetical protein